MKRNRLDNIVYPAAWDGRRSPPTTRKAVLGAFAHHRDFAAEFAAACRESAPAVRNMIRETHSVVFFRGHVFTTQENQFEEVGEVLFDLAGELMPGSPGAARKRLRDRVAARRRLGEPTVVEAIEALATEDYAAFDHLVSAVASPDDTDAVFHTARHVWRLLCIHDQRYEPPLGIEKVLRVVIANVFSKLGEEQ